MNIASRYTIPTFCVHERVSTRCSVQKKNEKNNNNNNKIIIICGNEQIHLKYFNCFVLMLAHSTKFFLSFCSSFCLCFVCLCLSVPRVLPSYTSVFIFFLLLLFLRVLCCLFFLSFFFESTKKCCRCCCGCAKHERE